MPAKKSTKKVKAKKATKATAKVAASKSIKKPVVNGKKPYGKTQIMAYIAEATGVKKRDVGVMFDALSSLIEVHLDKRGPGEFNIPGLLKCRVVRKPATKARKGINPFTGEPTVFKAKPARNVVKIRPLKKLKEMVA